MKRRVWAYALTAIGAAIAAAGAAVAFCYSQYVVGAILSVLFVAAVFCFVGEIEQDNFVQKSEALFAARKYEEERALLEKVRKNHLLYPFIRERYSLTAIRNAVARDDLPLAKSYIDRLRHGGDYGIKYKTSFVAVLILLDAGEVGKARAEYEDFRIHNEHYALYQPQIEVLDALFKRLFTKNDTPLPESAVDSPYPVVKRILGRHFEERAADMNAAWEE